MSTAATAKRRSLKSGHRVLHAYPRFIRIDAAGKPTEFIKLKLDKPDSEDPPFCAEMEYADYKRNLSRNDSGHSRRRVV